MLLSAAVGVAATGWTLPDRFHQPVAAQDPVTVAAVPRGVPATPVLVEVPPDEVGLAPAAGPLAVGPVIALEDPADALPTPMRSFSSRGDRWADPSVDAYAPRWLPTAVPTPRPLVWTYHVAPGDRVIDIADRFGISPATVVRANGLADAEKLSVGQELTILAVSGRLHTVAQGDSVLGLANRYGVIPEAIAAANRLADADLIRPGQQLVIPMSPEQEQTAREAESAPPKPLAPIAYTVTSGDTVLGLATRYRVTAESIQWANQLADSDVLSIGQPLTIPPVSGVLHRVAAGDSLIGVASQYQASASDIVRANGLAEPFVIRPGDLLVVPGGRPGAPAPAMAAPASAAPTPAPAPAARSAPGPKAVQSAPAPAPARPAVAPPPPANPSIAGVAARFLGTPYVWGGTTPAGFDCSGFVMYVHRQAGIAVPRDLWGQLQSGRRVSRAQLQPGDIVFFQNTYMPGLSHNGIYVGGGRFVHAGSESTGVITSRLDDGYWGPRYLGATRAGG